MNSNPLSSEGNRSRLRLYVTGDSPRSLRAKRNLADAFVKLHIDSIEVCEVDLLENPGEALQSSIYATPALLYLKRNGRESVIYGDLSDEKILLTFLKSFVSSEKQSTV